MNIITLTREELAKLQTKEHARPLSDINLPYPVVLAGPLYDGPHDSLMLSAQEIRDLIAGRPIVSVPRNLTIKPPEPPPYPITRATQEIIDGARGDCFSACIATILGLPIAEVPKFCADAVDTGKAGSEWADIVRWLADRGYGIVVVHPKALHDRRGLVGLRAICRVPSQKFPGGTHAVVGSWRYHDPAETAIGSWVEWFIEHDPNPTNGPYPADVEAWGFVLLVPFCPKPIPPA